MQGTGAESFLRENVCLNQNLQTYDRRRYPIEGWVLDQLNSNLPDFLRALEQMGDTLTHLHVLSTFMHTCDATAAAWAYIIPSTAHLLTHLDTSKFTVWFGELYVAVDLYTEYLFAQNSASTSIKPLYAALKLIEGVVPPKTLTPMHRMFMKAVLLSGFGHMADKFISEPLTNVSKAHVASKDVLLYYYYASLVCIVQKDYQKAYDCLTMVLGMPSESPTPIAIKAYKLLMLVSLLYTHEPLSEKPIHIGDYNDVKVYHQIASHYAKGDQVKLRELIAAKRSDLVADGTYALSELCAQSLPLAKAARLTTTYLTLALSEISETVGLSGPEEAEMLVLHMIERNEIYAKINQANGTVSFDESPQQFAARDTTLMLHSQIESLIKLNQSVHAADQHVQDITDTGKDTTITQRGNGPRAFDDGHDSDSAGSYAAV